MSGSVTIGVERAIQLEVTVAAPLSAVFEAWTTVDGVRGFFAPDARIDLVPGGPYELRFMLDAPAGTRGGEGCQVLAVEPPTSDQVGAHALLSVSWNAPPHLPDVRRHYTVVIVRFRALAGGQTDVSLTHVGWGEGEQWQEAFAYFERAWSQLVLPRLRHRFAAGSVEWDDLPELEPVS